MPKNPNTPVAVPPAVADNIANYIQQQQQLGAILQATVRTAGQVLNVPEGWNYDPAQRAFVPPPARPEQPPTS